MKVSAKFSALIAVPLPSDLLDQEELNQRITIAMLALPERQRAVIEARFGLVDSERPMPAIAKELGITTATARALEQRGLRRLRQPSIAAYLRLEQVPAPLPFKERLTRRVVPPCNERNNLLAKDGFKFEITIDEPTISRDDLVRSSWRCSCGGGGRVFPNDVNKSVNDHVHKMPRGWSPGVTAAEWEAENEVAAIHAEAERMAIRNESMRRRIEKLKAEVNRLESLLKS
jgi:hypothetical protein